MNTELKRKINSFGATEQDAFDNIVTTLFAQKEPCKGAGGECVYRDGKGKVCAAGAMIPDSEYFEGLEGNGWAGLIAKGVAPTQHAGLIIMAQFIHDSPYGMGRGWVDGIFHKFTLLAKLLDLNTSALNSAYAMAKDQQCTQ